MIKIENVEVVGWEASLRGMRNPKNSWDKSDSTYCWNDDTPCQYEDKQLGCLQDCQMGGYIVGSNDLTLANTLAKGGPVHAKYRRMITVYLDITAPLYWWKEFDTYKVGTVANSCSTMHKLSAKEFTREDFSCEHLTDDALPALDGVINELNYNRKKFLETKDKTYWWNMIQLLPSSYNQKRTVMLNYEVLHNMYYAPRWNHKLDEWREFCKWIETLPYATQIILSKGQPVIE